MQKIKYILCCVKCDSYVITDDIEFKEYDDKEFICNRCLGIEYPHEYTIDSNIHSGMLDKRKSNKGVNKKRRKGENIEW